MLDPPDMTSAYNTQLSPTEEALFQAWATKSGRAKDMFDYDLRGAWRANAQAAADGHLPDTWKKPNHPTFSDESVYNGKDGAQGGKWAQKGSQWQFVASPYNVTNMGPEGLQLYFKHVEPDAVLVMPQGGR